MANDSTSLPPSLPPPLTSLRDFAQAYELVKSERNVVYSQIQSYQQLSAEMREKLKVLQNEKEILHNAVDSKTKYAQSLIMTLISYFHLLTSSSQSPVKITLSDSQ